MAAQILKQSVSGLVHMNSHAAEAGALECKVCADSQRWRSALFISFGCTVLFILYFCC